jgi:ribosomal-protein-alanine N-acetyltransferase
MQISTDRLILREFRESDWPDVLVYQQDPRYLRFTPWTERTPEAGQDFVQMFLDQQRAQPRLKYQLALTLKSNHRLVGNCGIRLETADAYEGDIGYELSPQYWGFGYATEAARAIVNFGFTELKLHRIWSWCIAENVGSVRVLQKIGMQLEGRLRDKEYFKGRWWDTLVFSILEPEWQATTSIAGSHPLE